MSRITANLISRRNKPIEQLRWLPAFSHPDGYGIRHDLRPNGCRRTLAAYTRLAYMLFVELAPFAKFCEQYWTDGELAGFQRFLLATPDAGSLIPGAGGLRKVRWLALGHGKRGGARVVYYRYIAADRIYLIHGYMKNRRDDLTKAQLNVIRRLLRDVIDG